MNKQTALIAIVLAFAFAAGVFAAQAQTAHAANPISGFAQTNGNYQTGCETFTPARECATGSGDNGDFTCGLAQFFNGPSGGVTCGTQGVPPPPQGPP
jgi:hypothetical protein